MTTIGPSSSFTGDISSDEDLHVDGSVRGDILVRQASVTVGPQARIEGRVRGLLVRVHGAVHGTIAASERIDLGPTADVVGDLSANTIVVADGARLQGRVDMDRRTIAAKVAQYKAVRG